MQQTADSSSTEGVGVSSLFPLAWSMGTCALPFFASLPPLPSSLHSSIKQNCEEN